MSKIIIFLKFIFFWEKIWFWGLVDPPFFICRRHTLHTSDFQQQSSRARLQRVLRVCFRASRYLPKFTQIYTNFTQITQILWHRLNCVFGYPSNELWLRALVFCTALFRRPQLATRAQPRSSQLASITVEVVQRWKIYTNLCSFHFPISRRSTPTCPSTVIFGLGVDRGPFCNSWAAGYHRTD